MVANPVWSRTKFRHLVNCTGYSQKPHDCQRRPFSVCLFLCRGYHIVLSSCIRHTRSCHTASCPRLASQKRHDRLYSHQRILAALYEFIKHLRDADDAFALVRRLPCKENDVNMDCYPDASAEDDRQGTHTCLEHQAPPPVCSSPHLPSRTPSSTLPSIRTVP